METMTINGEEWVKKSSIPEGDGSGSGYGDGSGYGYGDGYGD